MADRREHTLDAGLMENWQRGFPVIDRPFQVLAESSGVGEAEVLSRLQALRESGVVARVGAVVRPNTIGASTLAAVSVPSLDVDLCAQILTEEPGVNHVYLRENDWNMWFVATGPDRDFVDAALGRIAARTGRKVLDLRLERSYHIDLGFALFKDQSKPAADPERSRDADPFTPEDGDDALVQQLLSGLPLVPEPYAAIAEDLGREVDDMQARIRQLLTAGVLPRLGVIVRHRALGWRSNAMVVWDVPTKQVDQAGAVLAGVPGVNLCYRRRRHQWQWPYNLYCMIHAKSRDDALRTLARGSAEAGLDGLPRQILFSERCFKQTSALVATKRPQEAA